MSLVRYCANCSKYTITLGLSDGRNISLQFDGKNPITKERFADVSDPLIQEALEKSSSLNLYFYKSKEFDWMKEGDEITPDMVVIPGSVVVNYSTQGKDETGNPVEKEFENWKDAKSWLNTELNVSFKELPNQASVVSRAKKLGFELVFSKDKN